MKSQKLHNMIETTATDELFSLVWKNLEAHYCFHCFHCFGRIWKLTTVLFSLFSDLFSACGLLLRVRHPMAICSLDCLQPYTTRMPPYTCCRENPCDHRRLALRAQVKERSSENKQPTPRLVSRQREGGAGEGQERVEKEGGETTVVRCLSIILSFLHNCIKVRLLISHQRGTSA